MSLDKARVQLLDPTTNAVISEVDILTAASAVGYTNSTPTIVDIGGIPAGSTFEEGEASVQDVLDKLLYPYTKPTIKYITDNGGKQHTENATIYAERFKEIRPFFLESEIQIGDRTDITITIKRYNGQTNQVTNYDASVKATPGSLYRFSKEVEKMSEDTRIQLIVSDGVNIIESPIISYQFIYPAFVGFCEWEEITVNDIISDTKANEYFNTLIRNNSAQIKKILTPMANLSGMTMMNAIYSETELYPFILYPNTWTKIVAIKDINGNDITSSFAYDAVSVKPDSSVTSNVQYTFYASMRAYNVQLAAAGSIAYNFIDDKVVTGKAGTGIPTLSGFDPLFHEPLDLREKVDTYDDLIAMKYPYDGLVTYVVEEKTYFRYNGESQSWETTNQKIYLSTSGIAPISEEGAWDDVTIDIKSGIFYQKYMNVRWQEKGRYISGLGMIDVWDAYTTFPAGATVYYDNKFWEAILESTGVEPGTNEATWQEVVIGDAATIVIEEIKALPLGSTPTVQNLGDMQNARFVIGIPMVPTPPGPNMVLVTDENGDPVWKNITDILKQ